MSKVDYTWEYENPLCHPSALNREALLVAKARARAKAGNQPPVMAEYLAEIAEQAIKDYLALLTDDGGF